MYMTSRPRFTDFFLLEAEVNFGPALQSPSSPSSPGVTQKSNFNR